MQMASFISELTARYFGMTRLRRFAYEGERPAVSRTGAVIEDLFWTNDGPVVDKWHHYLPLYEKYLTPWRGRPVRMLEIGVHRGGSLKLWRDFFGPEAVIFGIDINPACAAFDGQSGQVRIGSQANPAFLRKVVAEMGGIDIVLDDGSHVSAHMRASLDALYPQLSEGGLYIVEDVHACYWTQFGGGYRRPGSFVETVKTMIDDMHHWYHTQGQRIGATADNLGAVHVHDSMVVLEKTAVAPPRRSQRGRA
jgi:hypothetical protein